MTNPEPAATQPAPTKVAVNRILTAAWLAILLGLAVQVLVLVVRMAAGANFPGMAFIAEVTQGVTWALIVCGGIAIGMAAQSARTMLGGVLGLISGPLGWGAAKAAQRSVQALVGAPVDQIGAFFYWLCAVKGIEYFALGLALGWLSQRPDAGVRLYAGLGFIVGLVTAAVVVALNIWHFNSIGQPMAFAKIAGLAIGELTFPIGCALVIYAPFRLKRYANL